MLHPSTPAVAAATCFAFRTSAAKEASKPKPAAGAGASAAAAAPKRPAEPFKAPSAPVDAARDDEAPGKAT